MPNFPRFSKENIGSLVRIDYIPAIAFLNFKQTSLTQIAATGMSVKPGFGWSNIHCSEDTMGHQQNLSSDGNGDFWQQQVIGFIPGDEPAIEVPLAQLSPGRYVLRITLPNGIVKIVGSPSRPLDFTLKSDSTQQYSGRPGTTITFTGNTLARALFYIG